MGLDARDPCRIDVGREPTLHAETAAEYRKESHRSTVETTVKQVEAQTAWIADSDGGNETRVTTRPMRLIVCAGGILREKQWGWTRFKQRMQTHGFLERNENKTSDNVEDGGQSKEKEVVVVGREWRIVNLTRSAH